MQSMHHRVRGASSAAVAATSTTSSSSSANKRRKRIAKSVSIKTNELWIVVAGTGVLTVAAVLIVLRLSGNLLSAGRFKVALAPGESYPAPAAAAADDDGAIPWNPLYTVPDSMPTVGDRSDEYVTLRKSIDQILPKDPRRSLNFVQSLDYSLPNAVVQQVTHSDQVPYDIFDCPNTPPDGYPFTWKLTDVLNDWNPNNVQVPDKIHQSLCIFDFKTDIDKAMVYRTAELPFLVVNDPEVAATVERWNHGNYFQDLLGDEPHRTEYSENNHFMYYIPVPKTKNKKRNNRRLPHLRAPEGWKEPTKLVRMTYKEWLRHANTTKNVGPEDEHWYYRLIGCGSGMGEHCDQASSEYLFDELPFFQPKESLYVVEPDQQKGIHCRFGMKGVIAENHFDGSRNAIVVLGGSRRYILAHPDQCENLALFPKGHPSARHSAVDWTNPDLNEYPEFGEAIGNEVVMTPGMVLYLPTTWFHFIVSLEVNFQCNTRSGISDEYADYIHDCGF